MPGGESPRFEQRIFHACSLLLHGLERLPDHRRAHLTGAQDPALFSLAGGQKRSRCRRRRPARPFPKLANWRAVSRRIRTKSARLYRCTVLIGCSPRIIRKRAIVIASGKRTPGNPRRTMQRMLVQKASVWGPCFERLPAGSPCNHSGFNLAFMLLQTTSVRREHANLWFAGGTRASRAISAARTSFPFAVWGSGCCLSSGSASSTVGPSSPSTARCWKMYWRRCGSSTGFAIPIWRAFPRPGRWW